MSMTAGPGRGYRYYTGLPLFRFGFGLSYGAHALAKHPIDWGVCVSTGGGGTRARAAACTARRFTVVVSNSAARDSAETVQAYFVPPATMPASWKAPVPVKRLIGFQKAHVAAGGGGGGGAGVPLTFVVKARQLQLVDETGIKRDIAGATFGLVFTNGDGETVEGSFEIEGGL